MPTQIKLVPIVTKHTAPPRKTTAQRGYGSAHQKARERYLAKYPICQRCENAISTDLHHIDLNTFNRAESNLLALCENCHHAGVHGRG